MTELPILHTLPSVTLSGLDERAALMSRAELKFMPGREMLPGLLQQLSGEYQILDINGMRAFQYHSRYFDTEDLTLYRMHTTGNKRRIKVRQRLYADTGRCYFEVKQKHGFLHTEKVRTPITQLHDQLSEAELLLLPAPARWQVWLPQLHCTFTRITLCHHSHPERLTIDTDMILQHGQTIQQYPYVAVIEIKQARAERNSKALRVLRDAGLHAGPMSKYATGIALTHPQARYNAMKPTLMSLNKTHTQTVI